MKLANNAYNDERTFWNLIVVVFAIVLPTFVTLVYFKWLANSPPALQQSAYAIGKAIQFLLPVVWVWLFFRYRFARDKKGLAPDENTDVSALLQIPDWMFSVGFGIKVCLVLVIAWFFILSGSDSLVVLTERLQQKVSDLGIDRFWKYASLGIFYAVVHSFLEEYYWRWFVYDLLKRFVSIPLANLVSSLGFMAHHVVLLSVYFGWESPLTYVCSLGVAIGGIVWAWIYERSGSLVWPWLSHAIVDAGLFLLGYILLADVFAS